MVSRLHPPEPYRPGTGCYLEDLDWEVDFRLLESRRPGRMDTKALAWAVKKLGLQRYCVCASLFPLEWGEGPRVDCDARRVEGGCDTNRSGA